MLGEAVIRSAMVGVVFFVSAWLSPGAAWSLDLGLSPNHVFGLWVNIYKAYESLENDLGLVPEDDNGPTPLIPNSFEGKTPTDVFNKAIVVQSNLIEIFELDNPPPIPRWIRDFQALEVASSEAKTTPSQVFVLSSQILNALVEKHIDVTQGRLPVGGFYSDTANFNKTPSDVFGLVDLLARRLERVKTTKENRASTIQRDG